MRAPRRAASSMRARAFSRFSRDPPRSASARGRSRPLPARLPCRGGYATTPGLATPEPRDRFRHGQAASIATSPARREGEHANARSEFLGVATLESLLVMPRASWAWASRGPGSSGATPRSPTYLGPPMEAAAAQPLALARRRLQRAARRRAAGTRPRRMVDRSGAVISSSRWPSASTTSRPRSGSSSTGAVPSGPWTSTGVPRASDLRAIGRRLARRKGARERGAACLAVVTADRAVAARARHRGAQIVSPRQFLARCQI